MAAALHGRIDAILFTGGLAHSQLFVDQIANQIGFLAPCHTYPGEDEMYALAANAYAVLTGQESPENTSDQQIKKARRNKPARQNTTNNLSATQPMLLYFSYAASYSGLFVRKRK